MKNIKFIKDYIYKKNNNVFDFVIDGDNYSSSFGIQWNIWPHAQFDSITGFDYSEEMFKKITGIDNLNILNGLTVLDVGCGPGRFIEICRKYGAIVCGIDYSSAAYVAARNFINDPEVIILRASATNLPLESEQFDLVYSIGVLHHVEDPYMAFIECTRVCKIGGKFAISVYGKNSYYDLPHLNLFRKLLNLFSEKIKKYLAFSYSIAIVSIFYPFHKFINSDVITKILRSIIPHAYAHNYIWSILDTYDSITPKFQYTYYSYEIYDWFSRNMYYEIKPTKWHSCSMIAKRGS